MLIQNFGMSDVLVSRGKSFMVLHPLAQSLSILFAISAFVLSIILGFTSQFVYGSKELFYLIVIMSLSIPFNALSVLPDAKLRIDLKFRSLNLIQVFSSFGTQLLTILFALLSLGVYSFVIAPVLIAIFRYAALSQVARVHFQWHFTLRHSKVLLNNSTWSFVYALFQRFIQQGDYLIIGFFVTKAMLGVYYLAYSLSVQVIGFLVNSINPVLFPTLMKIPKNEKDKIREALLKITTYFSLLGMPFACWQAVCAEPLILIFLEEKWEPAIELVQILSLGIGFSVVGALWAIAIRIRSEFFLQAKLSAISTSIFVCFLIIGTYFNNLTGAAISVSLYHMLVTPFLIYYSFKYYGVEFLQLMRPILTYSFLSISVFGVFFFIVSANIEQMWYVLLLNGIIAPIAYLIIVGVFNNQLLYLLRHIISLKNN